MTFPRFIFICVFIFMIGFGGTLWLHALTHPGEPEPAAQTASAPTLKQRGQMLFQQLNDLEECLKRTSQEEYDSYRSCRPERVVVNPLRYLEALIELVRGLSLKATMFI